MINIFKGLPISTFTQIYIDDMIIFSHTFEDHMLHIETVLSKLQDANLRLNPAKCRFAVDSTKYLGFIISCKGVQTDEDKVQVIKTFPVPTDVPSVRSFLGLVGYYRRFIKNFSIIAGSLYDLLKKDAKFSWTADCQKAFETLRNVLCQAPVLGFPNVNKDFIVTVDSSTKAVGYVLSQKDENGVEHPIVYSGHTLNSQQQKWGISDIECLGLVSAVREFHPYLAHRPFQIYTDHISLKWLSEIKHRTGRLYRWSLLLSPYSYTIFHKPGVKIPHCDALSRRTYPPGSELPYDQEVSEVVLNLDSSPNIDNDIANTLISNPEQALPSEDKLDVTESKTQNDDNKQTDNKATEYTEITFEYEDELPIINALTDSPPTDVLDPLDNLPQLQRECKDLGRIINYLESGELPDDDKLARKTVFEAESYFIKDNTLYHHVLQRGKHNDVLNPVIKQIAVPVILRHEILVNYHDNFSHNGQDRMYATLRNKLYWNTMYADVREYVKTCTVCQTSKRSYHPQRVPMQCQQVEDIFCRYHMDILDLKQKAKSGHKYLLIVVESLSRHPEAFPLYTQSASEVATILFRHIICRYGQISSLVSDRGANFTSELIKHMCSLFKINRVKTGAYSPKGNSACERFNSTILAAFRCYLDKQHENWTDYIDAILYAYRGTVSTNSTRFSPFFILFARQMKLPVDSVVTVNKQQEQRRSFLYRKTVTESRNYS